MDQPAKEESADLTAFEIMDYAEQYENLLQTKHALRKLDESLRGMVSPQVWDLIIQREEQEADYRLQLVKNVITLTLAMQSDAKTAATN